MKAVLTELEKNRANQLKRKRDDIKNDHKSITATNSSIELTKNEKESKILQIKNNLFNFNKFSTGICNKTTINRKKYESNENNNEIRSEDLELALNDLSESKNDNINNLNYNFNSNRKDINNINNFKDEKKNALNNDTTLKVIEIENNLNINHNNSHVNKNENENSTAINNNSNFNPLKLTDKPIIDETTYQKFVDFIEIEREKFENKINGQNNDNNNSNKLSGNESISSVSDIFNLDDEVENNKHLNNEQRGVLDLPCIDAAEDNEGYYIPKVNEVINNDYLVNSIIGKGVFSCVLSVYKLKDKTEESALKILRNNELMRLSGEKEKSVLIKLNKGDPNST